MPIAIVALALGAFGIGLAEFAVMGLLPDIADDLTVSLSTAGNLVTANAVGVVVGAPLLTAAASRTERSSASEPWSPRRWCPWSVAPRRWRR